MPSSSVHSLTADRVWLAPMAGVTDLAFRTVCKRMGAEVMVSEMVSADGLIYRPAPSLTYAKFTEEHCPFGIQLFGSEPDVMARSLAVVLPLQPDFIDVNMGCPVKKVINRGAGSALMQDPERAAVMVQAMKRELAGTGLPLSVKIRAGWDAASINAVEMAQRLEEAGADILTIHARTRTQMYGGNADWDLIARVVDALSIPVVGNGDIWLPEDAMRMRQHTGCASVMVGRGCMGRPWLFRHIAAFRLTGGPGVVDCQTKVACIREHYRLAMQDKGMPSALKEMRAHLAWYTKAMHGATEVRRLVNRSRDPEEVLAAVEELYIANNGMDIHDGQ